MDRRTEPDACVRLIAVQNSLVLVSAAIRRTTTDPSALSVAIPRSSPEAFSRAVASTADKIWSR
jgi:hypothetical protein